MSFSQPSYVMFDLGNVLVQIHPEAFLRTLGIDSPENRTHYQRPVTEIVQSYERGDDSTERFLQNLAELFNAPGAAISPAKKDHEFSAGDFRRAMLSIIGQPIAGMDEIVKALGARVPIGLLSNTNPLHFEACLEHLAVLRFIPSHFLSYRLKSLKPHPEIFLQAIEFLQLDPGDILYVDDLPDNIEAGRKVGLNSQLFVGQEELRKQLIFSGLP
jgi:putative hydrolase of the HAD superfamily